MRRLLLSLLPISLLMTAPVAAQTAADKVAPTIPETLIKPAEMSSPYEFLSASTSADEFVIKASALAATNAASPEVVALAKDLAAAHTAAMAASQAAAKQDKVDIAAPSPDGEQQGLLGKLEGLKGAEFDRAYVEALLFVHQRTIAYTRGWADEGGSLGTFAADSVATLVTHYQSLLALAEKVGIGSATQQPAQ